MSDKTPAAAKPVVAPVVAPVVGPDGVVVPPVRRHPGHRGADVRDTVAEMAAKAHEISMEAGSKMAAAMKEVVGAAAGLSTFTLESARDLVQYMVRRSQMTQEEADKLMKDAEEAWSKKHKGKKPPPRIEAKPKPILKPIPYSLPKTSTPPVVVAKKVAPPAKKAVAAKVAHKKPAAKKAAKPAAKKAAKPAAKKPSKPAAKKPAKKKPAPKK